MNWFLFSIAAFFSSVVSHAVLVRIYANGDTATKFMLVGGGFGMLLIIVLLKISGIVITTLAAIALYAFLCELYIFCFTFVISSVAVAILIALLDTKSMSILDAESGARMTKRRIHILQQNGFLRRQISGDLELSMKGRFFVLGYCFLRRFFRIG